MKCKLSFHCRCVNITTEKFESVVNSFKCINCRGSGDSPKAKPPVAKPSPNLSSNLNGTVISEHHLNLILKTIEGMYVC